MTQNIVTAERRRLAPHIERVTGAEEREIFRAAFDNAAGRYALGKIDGPEFSGIVGELIRDAAGTAAQQDREADRREPWATMPTDGSDRLTLPERIAYALVGAACVATLILIAWTTGLIGGSDADAATPTVPPAGVSATDDRERELIIEGGYLAWQAWTECGNGPAACDTALRELNANPYGVTVMEDGSLIKREDDPNRVTVSLSELPSGDCWWEIKNDGTTETLCR